MPAAALPQRASRDDLKTYHFGPPDGEQAGAPRLSAAEFARLVLWKTGQRIRASMDGAGGFRRMERAGERWAERWLAREGDVRRWLRRAGAGSFWIPADAQRWARESCTPDDIRIAEAAGRGELSVLGATALVGAPGAWRRDLYSGHPWPLVDAHRLAIQRADGSDIRTVWEISRCYHFVPLARAYWQSGDPSHRDVFARHVETWIADNRLGLGPHWASPMDVAIRSANWAVAALLFADAPGMPAGFWASMLGNLYASGLFLERHLEWHPAYRGNHFVSNGVGLVYLGTLFRGERAGERWLHTGARILTEEILRQVGDDGVSFESSLAYHRLVTEFFAYGGDLVQRNLPDAWREEHQERLRAMFRFVAAYLPPGGEAPMLGDADDGRLHAVSARGMLEPRRHALGLPETQWREAEASAASGAFPRGGFYVLRSGADHAVVRCGAVGLRGAGSHDHNDQLSLELVLGGRRVVADSGTYAYTRDLAARFAFRSTAAHSVVQLGDEEQNPIRKDRPWRILADRTRSRCTEWEVSDHAIRFAGRHFGYAHRPSGAVCTRRIVAHPEGGTWEVEDRVDGRGRETLAWRLHLAPLEVEVVRSEGRVLELRLPGEPAVTVVIRLPEGVRAAREESDASDRYGSLYRRPCIVARGEVQLPAVIHTTFVVSS